MMDCYVLHPQNTHALALIAHRQDEKPSSKVPGGGVKDHL